MITEDYVSFETAKLLKENGFNRFRCQNSPHFAYNKDGLFSGPSWDTEYSAPTLQMAMKWLREVHNLDIITPPQFDNSKWTYSAIIFKLSIPCTEIKLNNNKDKKEEACEAAIRYCLEILI